MDGWRLLFRHGGEGGAVLEVQWHLSEKRFTFGDPVVDECDRRDWHIVWHEQIHKRESVAEAA
jgi:hypothetical protein